MTIIAVKKDEKQITIWSDSQITAWNTVSYGKKIYQVWEIIFGGAGYLSELQIMDRFLKDNWYDEKTIKSESELFNLFSNFLQYLKTKWVIDNRENYEKTVFNSFIIVVKNLGKVYEYNSWCLLEISDFRCVWSWQAYWMSILDETGSVHKAIEYAKKYDVYCGGDSNIIKISIK